MRHVILSFILVFLILGCSDKLTEEVALEKAKTEATVSVFRFMFEQNGSMLERRAASYCIGFGKGKLADPDQKFLDRFHDVTPKVKAASSCHFDNYIVIDRDSGKPSLLFNLSASECETADRCRFEGGYLEASLSASGGGYLVERIGDTWSVKTDPKAPSWVS